MRRLHHRLIFFLLLFFAQNAWAASSGPNNPGTTADDASVGTSAWSNTGNSVSQNNTYASNQVQTSGSHYLKVTNFGFSIPAGSTIDGITVDVDKYWDGNGTGPIKDFQVRIVKGGTIGSTDRANANTWTTPADTDTYITYGSSSDLWGETWTSTDINASDFGFAIAAYDACSMVCLGPFGDNTFIDHIRVTINYTESSRRRVAIFER